MDLELKSPEDEEPISERRRTEIEYHRKLNVRIALACMPIFLFFSIFFWIRSSYLQALLFALMFVNAGVVVTMVPRIKDMEDLMRLKQVGSAIAFVLLGVSMVASFFGQDLYIMFPYFFIYPIAVLLFFGERVGRYYAIAFCLVTVSLVMFFQFSPWEAPQIELFKMNTAMAFIIIVVIALISERTRVQMRDQLIEARQQAEAAESRQRHTNIELKQEILRRTKSEEALSKSEKRYRALFEESAVSLWEEDWSLVKTYLDGLHQEAAEDLLAYLKTNAGEVGQCVSRMQILAINRAALKLYEADTPAALVKNFWRIMLPEFDLNNYMADRVAALYNQGRFETDIEFQSLKGRRLHAMVCSTVPSGFEDSWEKVYTSVYDITEKVAMEQEKKRLDMQVQHTRHFQAIATLAGGIAHQFNNALGGIYGNLDLLEIKLRIDEKSRRYIAALRAAASRIAHLTEQLLAYARGGKFQPQAISLNTLLEDLLSTDILPEFPEARISTDLSPKLGQTVGDVTQIRAVMAAILTNAMEAIDKDGAVTVTTSNQTVDNDHPTATGLQPGNYVVTAIEDSGVGMDEQTLQQIFEPFFSTKFVGRGLGMSAASGIVKNHGGDIFVDSALGKGTKVTVYLPVEETSTGGAD